VTFKDLRKIIAEKNREIEREAKLYNPSHYWKYRKIVSLGQLVSNQRKLYTKSSIAILSQ
jgi:hypothetical protein